MVIESEEKLYELQVSEEEQVLDPRGIVQVVGLAEMSPAATTTVAVSETPPEQERE